MAQRMRWLVIIVALFAAIVLGLIGYFAYINIAYVDTLHARVDGAIVQVRAPATGRVVDLPPQVGDAVAEGEELATLESASAATGQSQAARVLAPIRAPVSGIVTDIATAVDDIVSPGQLMVTLVDPGKVWVTANIHESRIPQVQIGQSVRITVRTRTVRRKFWGRVEQIGRATTLALPGRGRNADISTPSLAEVPIRISLDSVGRELYPGMTADVRIRLNPRFFANSAREY